LSFFEIDYFSAPSTAASIGFCLVVGRCFIFYFANRIFVAVAAVPYFGWLVGWLVGWISGM
jgi:hypothetical protein